MNMNLCQEKFLWHSPNIHLDGKCEGQRQLFDVKTQLIQLKTELSYKQNN